MTREFTTKGEYMVRGTYFEHRWKIEFDESGSTVISVHLDGRDVTNVYLNKEKTHKDYYKIVRNVSFYKNTEKKISKLAYCYSISYKGHNITKYKSVYSKSKTFKGNYFGTWVDSQNEGVQDILMTEYNEKLAKIKILEDENYKILKRLKELSVNDAKIADNQNKEKEVQNEKRGKSKFDYKKISKEKS